MHQDVARFSLHVDAVGQDHLVHAVEIPLVVRRHLVHPLRLAGVDVTRPDRHRPLVVAGALHRVPGAGVARAVVHQVELRVVAVPAPGRAAADLPLIALPGLERRVPAHRRHLAVGPGHRRVRIDQHLRVRPGAVGLPDLLAGLDVVGGDVTTHAELAAGNAGDHLVLEDVRGVGVGLTLLRIAVLDLPQLLAGPGVERDEVGVGLLQEDLAVGVGETAVHRVAAHHGDHRRVLLRLVLPLDLLIGEGDREDLVGKRAVDVQHVADHQGAALVAAQHAGRECPRDAQVLDVVRADLLERAVAVVLHVARLHRPVLRVLAELDDLRIGERESRQGGEAEQNAPRARACQYHLILLCVFA